MPFLQKDNLMILGHKRQLSVLDSIQERNAIPHSLIFSGPEHVGKKTIAKAFFNNIYSGVSDWHSFLTTDNQLTRRIRSGEHPDIFTLDTPGKINIASVRALRRFTRLSPFEQKVKFAIIDNAHLIGSLGSNTLLKTLEEPPDHTHIVLVTHRPERLPLTVRSRSLLLPFTLVPDSEILKMGRGKVSALKKEMAWIAGRPGLSALFIKSPNDPELLERITYFKTYGETFKRPSIAVKLQLAEKISKTDQQEIALEALLLAAREQMLKGDFSAARRARKIMNCLECLQLSNANARIALENGFLA